MGSDSETLNEYQQRRLWVTCKHVDELLSSMEATLNETASKRAFPKYVPDISPAQRRVIEDYIARIRAQLGRVLKGQNVELPAPSIPASRSLSTAVTFIDIAVEELKPKYMRGYGKVPETAAGELNGIVGELQSLVAKLNGFLAQGVGQDLRDRLNKLEQTGGEVELLSALELMIGKYGLVEFRSALSIALDRLEDKSFEIAVFGRVSSGKSSLLNGILQSEALPVGVTPITAVPTRIAFGEQPGVTVWFAERSSSRFELSQLAEFVTEQQNPGNARHVSRILVQLPSKQLRDGIVFVDTPGLGSLATTGAAETLAYLPRCDLGVVLIDAASSLAPDDLQTIQLLYQAGIPANVLLSKADLLNPNDVNRLAEYTKRQILSELRLDLAVHPVSSMPSHRSLLDRWFEEEIRPLYERAQELKQASVRRKVGSLRQSVTAALEAQLRRSRQGAATTDQDLVRTESRLRHATARLEEARPVIRRITEDMGKNSASLLVKAAHAAVDAWSSQQATGDSAPSVANGLVALVQQSAASLDSYLQALALELADHVQTVAANLNLPDSPTEQEFRDLVREMPVFDFAAPCRIDRPKLSAVLGKAYTERAIKAQLDRQIGDAFTRAAVTYAALLQDWAERVLRQIRQRFELYAEGYRAQIERSLAGRQLSPETIEAIQRDLAALESKEREGAVATGRAIS
jgi:GTP-binding protein EngB required for normal cell division